MQIRHLDEQHLGSVIRFPNTGDGRHMERLRRNAVRIRECERELVRISGEETDSEALFLCGWHLADRRRRKNPPGQGKGADVVGSKVTIRLRFSEMMPMA